MYFPYTSSLHEADKSIIFRTLEMCSSHNNMQKQKLTHNKQTEHTFSERVMQLASLTVRHVCTEIYS